MAAGARNAAIVLVMAGSASEAEKIARALVAERLAACANIIAPVRSIYRWRGAIESAAEHLIMIKTARQVYRKLERRVLELHSYEVPEILLMVPAGGSAAYLDWIFESTTAEPAAPRPAGRARSSR